MRLRTPFLSEAALEAAANQLATRLIPSLQAVPRPLLNPLAMILGDLSYLLWGRVRNIAIDNISHAFPAMSLREVRRLARRTFRNWGVFLLESLKLGRYSQQDWDERTIAEGEDVLKAALARGKGVILISGHLGCFEMGAAQTARHGYPTSVVVRYAKTAALTEKVNEARESAGYKVLCYDTRGLKTVRALRRNELVAILIDQNESRRGVFVNFFGRPASTTPGPAIVASRTGAALLPAWVVREADGRYRTYLEPEVPNPGPDADEAAIQRTMQELTSRLEEKIRQYPDQWLWMHRRWKTQPSSDTAPTESTPAPSEELQDEVAESAPTL